MSLRWNSAGGFSRIHTALLLLMASALSSAAAGQFVPEAPSARSFSGQFIVRSRSITGVAAPVLSSTNKSIIRLEQTLVTVSCERIKQLLYHELGVGPAWRGKIFIDLYPAQSIEEPVTIISDKFKDGWAYRVELPDLIERGAYIRAIVQSVLLEYANRNAEARSAEIPLWLDQGLAQQLLAANETEIILPPPQAAPNRPSMVLANMSARRDIPLQQVYKALGARPPLSFNELSWPDPQHLSGDAAGIYRSSSQLFINQLMSFSDGRAALRAMLSRLPERQNWQFALLDAFHSHFQSLLDVDKWWSLQLVHFARRDVIAQTWAFEESSQKLDEALHAQIAIRTATNDLPLSVSVTLQTIIREWDMARQTPSLQAKMRELELLRGRVSQDFLAVLDGYVQTLETYLQRQDSRGLVPLFRKSKRARAAEEAIQKLDNLDGLRMMLQPAQKSLVARKR